MTKNGLEFVLVSLTQRAACDEWQVRSCGGSAGRGGDRSPERIGNLGAVNGRLKRRQKRIASATQHGIVILSCVSRKIPGDRCDEKRQSSAKKKPLPAKDQSITRNQKNERNSRNPSSDKFADSPFWKGRSFPSSKVVHSLPKREGMTATPILDVQHPTPAFLTSRA